MSLASCKVDGRLLVALADDGGDLGSLADDGLRIRGIEDYEAGDDTDAFGMLSLINGGGFCLGGYAECRQWIAGGAVHVDVRSVTFMTALGGPTEWIEVDWLGHVEVFSTESGEIESAYVGTSEALRELAFLVHSPDGVTDWWVELGHVEYDR